MFSFWLRCHDSLLISFTITNEQSYIKACCYMILTVAAQLYCRHTFPSRGILEQKPDTFLSRAGTAFMRLFFRLLYHPLARSYDLVAATVSLGRWKSWVKSTTGLLAGPCVLELGFGPGHMQIHLAQAGYTPFGLDESWQMAHQARRRVLRSGQPARLARGLAQHLPFGEGSFNSAVATFPTNYIT
ncbi:MAG: class I SAM-dependent methyltransferase, partial [Chloroflexi bacterium]